MQANRYLLTAIKIGLGVILFLPLFVSNTMFFPFITAKNFAFRIIVEILAVLWVILILRDRRYTPGRSWALIFIVAATAVLTFATIFSIDPLRSFWSNFERMEGLLGFLHLAAYFLILVGVNKTEKDWWRFFHASFAASILVSIYALFQLGGVFEIHQGGVRVDSTLGNATYLAVYMLFHVFLALYYFLKTKNGLAQILYAVLMIFEGFILYQTATRGAILGLVGGLFIFAFLFGILSKERRLKYFSAGILAVLIFAAAGFYFIRDSQFVKSSNTLGRLSSMSLSGDDAQARLSIWNMSLQGFKERPILGWGPDNFTSVFSKYYDPHLWRREPWFDRSHNIVFDWLIAGGILGLLSYLGIFAATLWTLITRYRQAKITNIELSVFTGLLVGFLFHNLFVFDQVVSYIMFFAVIGFIHFLSRYEHTEKSHPLVTPGKGQVFSAVAIIAFFPIIYFFNIKPLMANYSLISALESANGGKFVDAQNSFRRAISLSPLGRREAREQYTHYATLIAGESQIPEDIRRSSLEDGIRESELEVKGTSLDARPYLFLGSAYNSAGRREDALKAFERALELSPTKQQIIFLVAQMHAESGNFERAVSLAKMGAGLDPTYGDAMQNLVSILIYADDKEAQANIDKLISEGRADAGILKTWGSLYASKKQYNYAADLYEKALELTPNDTQTRVSLARIYYDTGNSALAIAEIRKAMELDSAFKEQGEGLIKEIQSGKKL